MERAAPPTTRNVLIRRELPPQERVVERAAPVRERVVERAAPVRERVVERAAPRGGGDRAGRAARGGGRACRTARAGCTRARSAGARSDGSDVGRVRRSAAEARIAAGRGRGGAAADLQVRHAGCAAGLSRWNGRSRRRREGRLPAASVSDRRRPTPPFIRCHRMPHRPSYRRPESRSVLPAFAQEFVCAVRMRRVE